MDYQEYLANLHSNLNTPESTINELIQEAANSKVESKRRIIAGEASEVYDIGLDKGGHVILRIARNKPQEYEQEAWAIEQCRKIGLPVPEMLLIKHTNAEGQNLSMCVQTKLPGEPLERGGINFEEFSQKRRRKIVNQAGEVLSQIHSVKTQGFGPLNGQGKGPFSSFKDLMGEHVDHLEGMLKVAKEVNILASQIEEAFRILREKAQTAPTLNSMLSHGDYNQKHIMINERDELTGIIDWGEVNGHLPVNDFAKWDYWFGDRLPTKWLEEGYGDKSLFQGNYQDLMHWIRLNNGLGVLYWYFEKKYPPGVEKAKKELVEDLKFYS